MGYPITGELGKINSVTSSTDLDALNTAMKTLTLKFSSSVPTEDISGNGDTVTKKVAGLRDSSWDFEGRYPKASPRLGNSGLVTFSSGYVQYCESWYLDFDFGEEDITAFTGSAITDRVYRPSGRPVITGGYTVRAVSDTALSLPTAANGTGAAATFKITEDSTDPAFSGNIIITGQNFTTGGREQVKNEYTFEFADTVTSVAGSTLPAILPAGTVDAADWDTNGDGTPDVQAVIQTAASRTYTHYVFIRSLRVECAVGAVTKVTGTLRVTGTVTTA